MLPAAESLPEGDLFKNAGGGAAHDSATPTTETLSTALSTALTPQTQARATAVADAIRTDGATVAAELLLDAVSRERAAASA